MLNRVVNAVLDRIANRVYRDIWHRSTHVPDAFPWNAYPFNITEHCFKIATMETAQYVIDNMMDCINVSTSLQLLEVSVSQASKEGLYLEFGVFSGTTINFIADKIDAPVHGFDSFAGLPEPWTYTPAGHFDTKGKLPDVRDSVELHVGWFDHTLPAFIEKHSGPVSFIHIDSDLYSSAKTILYGLKDQIHKGTIIQFDEYFNYPDWKNHEYRAFQEFINDTDFKYEYLGYSTNGFSASVRII